MTGAGRRGAAAASLVVTAVAAGAWSGAAVHGGRTAAGLDLADVSRDESPMPAAGRPAWLPDGLPGSSVDGVLLGSAVLPLVAVLVLSAVVAAVWWWRREHQEPGGREGPPGGRPSGSYGPSGVGAQAEEALGVVVAVEGDVRTAIVRAWGVLTQDADGRAAGTAAGPGGAPHGTARQQAARLVEDLSTEEARGSLRELLGLYESAAFDPLAPMTDADRDRASRLLRTLVDGGLTGSAEQQVAGGAGGVGRG